MLHIVILGYIMLIIEANEAMVSYLPVDKNGGKGEKGAKKKIPPQVARPFLYLRTIGHDRVAC